MENNIENNFEILNNMHKEFLEKRKDNILWGEGPWQIEPFNLHTEKYKGYDLIFSRDTVFSGCWRGYIHIPKSLIPQVDEINIDELPFDVHGGITYVDSHLYGKSEKEGYVYIGFDTLHSHDYMPIQELLHEKIYKNISRNTINSIYLQLIKESKIGNLENIKLRNPKYRTLEYCIEEAKKLIDQILEQPCLKI